MGVFEKIPPEFFSLSTLFHSLRPTADALVYKVYPVELQLPMKLLKHA